MTGTSSMYNMTFMTETASCCTEGMIKFIVGKQGKFYYILEETLATAMPMKTFASKKVWYIGERCTTQTFELFAYYLDSKELPSIPTNSKSKAEKFIGYDIALYKLARFLDYRALENHLMDIFRAAPTTRDLLLTCPLVTKTYARTNARAHLRHYTVDGFLFQSSERGIARLDEEVLGHYRAANTRFISRVLAQEEHVEDGGEGSEPRDWKVSISSSSWPQALRWSSTILHAWEGAAVAIATLGVWKGVCLVPSRCVTGL